MIKNFERDTCKLNDYEKDKILPAVVAVLKRCVGRANAITNKKIINLYLADYPVNPARLRKVLHYIRTHHLVKGLIATGRGYFIAEQRKDFEDYIKSLDGRIGAILEVKSSMTEQMDELFPET